MSESTYHVGMFFVTLIVWVVVWVLATLIAGFVLRVDCEKSRSEGSALTAVFFGFIAAFVVCGVLLHYYYVPIGLWLGVVPELRPPPDPNAPQVIILPLLLPR